jgi:hypothetical protein
MLGFTGDQDNHQQALEFNKRHRFSSGILTGFHNVLFKWYIPERSWLENFNLVFSDCSPKEWRKQIHYHNM